MKPLALVQICTLLIQILITEAEDAPQILNPPFDTTAVQNRAVSFICRASGNPKPRIIWQKNGKRAQSSRILIKDVAGGSASVLRIEPVKFKRDDGTYTCLAENGIGDAVTAAARLTVIKEDEVPNGFPKILHHPTIKSVEKGGNAVMNCQVDGNPPPEVIWLKDHVPVDLDPVRHSLTDQGSLHIRQSVEQDEGEYECLAKNSHGTAQSFGAKLYVKERKVPPYFSIPFSTQYNVAPGDNLDITCVAAGSPVPFVKWREGAKDSTSGPANTPAVGKTILQLKNIRNNGNYTCTANSEQGTLEAHTFVKVDPNARKAQCDPITGCVSPGDLPTPPRNLKITDVTPTTMFLSWQSEYGVKYYVVQYKPRDSSQGYSEISGITTPSHTVTNLKPYTLYEFMVLGVSEKGRGLPSDVAEMTTLEAEPSSAPKNVRAKAVSSTSLQVDWDPPQATNGHIVGYRISYTTDARAAGGSWQSEMVGKEQTAKIHNLEPHVLYTVRVQGITAGGPGPMSRPVSVKTQHGVPSQVTDVTFPSSSMDSFRIKWTPPSSADFPVTGYKIYYNSSDGTYGHETVDSPVSDYTVRSLRPSTEYTVTIVAVSSTGEGPSSEPAKVVTKQTKPAAPPQAFTGKYLDSRRIEITWQPPEQDTQRGQIISYKIYYQPNDQESGDPLVATADGASRRHILKDLSTWTEYKIWMVAGTAVGDGPPTEPVIVRTDESGMPTRNLPDKPRKVNAVVRNATAVEVEWLPPTQKHQNGIIRGYLIFLQPVDDRDELIGDTYKYNIMDGNAVKYTITGLKPDTNYNIQVGAYTRSGDGELTKFKKVKTPPGVPGPPRIEDVRVTEDQGKVVVKVYWKKPEQTYGTLKGYRVSYGKKNTPREQWMSKEMLPADDFISVEGLGRGVVYEFRVAAVNTLGSGTETMREVSMPEGIPIGPPQNISFRFDSPSSAQITWDPPVSDMQNGQIVRYTMYFEANGTTTKTNVTSPQFNVDHLELRKEYIFRISAWTQKGEGKVSQNIAITTPAEVPPPPENVRAAAVNDTHALVWWTAIPDTVAQKISGYRVSYACVKEPRIICTHAGSVDTDISSAYIPNLELGRNYTVFVSGKTSRSVGQLSQKVTFRVAADEVPKDVHIVSITKESITLRWKPPLTVVPSRYHLSYKGKKVFLDPEGSTQTRQTPRGFNETANTEMTIHGLRPFTTYYINLTAIPLNGREAPPVQLEIKTAVDVPPLLFPPNFTIVTQTEMIRVQLKRATEEFGPIKHYLVVVVPSPLAIKHPDNYTFNELTRHEMNGHQKDFPYIAARFDRDTLPSSFDIGDGRVYGTFLNRQISSGHHYKIFVRAYVENANSSEPLYTSSSFSRDVSTDMKRVEAPVDLTVKSGGFGGFSLWWMIFIGIGACIVIALIILVVVFYRRRQSNKLLEQSKKPVQTIPVLTQKTANGNGNGHLHPTSNPETRALLSTTFNEEPEPSPNSTLRRDPVYERRQSFHSQQMGRHPPIPVEDLANHINTLKANDNTKFSQEYESIETNQQFTWENSNLDYNKPKNRYANVVAYDHARVVLKTLDDISGSDYINANFCDGFRKKNAYIATQGPLPDTFGDFWRMMWEQNCFSIVMMTKLEERARIKCDQYWPNRGSEVYGVIQVTLLDVQELAFYCIRTFVIQPVGHMDKREIKQFQFTGWPDHGVPDTPTPFLMFIRRVRSFSFPESGPLVVHCSAGVGRTGAYIVIDAMLDRLRKERTVDVYGHVTCLREQRNYMVQTEDQYVFIYDCVLEAVESPVSEVRATHLMQRVEKLNLPITGPDGMTGMELEFRRLAVAKTELSKFASANLPVNKPKNRMLNIMPFESTRVALEPIKGIDGSDYINASYVDGYKLRGAYIATQAPLKNTVDDFWRMLWEHNSTIVVMLTKLHERGRERCEQYWPVERSQRYQYFVVYPVAEYSMPSYILREFKVTDARDGQSRTIRQFQFVDWPEEDGVPKTGEILIDFIGQIHKTKEQFGQEGPITVHCQTGVGRTGVFVALSVILERLKYENVIDVFQTVKLLRTQRPSMVQTEDQYQFLYFAALEYISSFESFSTP